MSKKFLTNIDLRGTINASGDISGNRLLSTASSAGEGGEIVLALPSSGSTLATSVTIDIYNNKLRFFETGSTTRGVYIDLTQAASAVGTNLLGSAATGAMNYEQQQSTKVSGVSASGVTIVSRSFTTNGYPVQVLVTGDAENSTAGGWVKLQLYRDSTAIGKIIHVESSAASENVPFALTVIDTPVAGTYTYALKTVSVVSTGTMNFGETDGPVLTMIELSGPMNNAGVATSTTSGTVKLFSDTAQSVAANSVSNATSRTYGVQLNSSGQAVVNVPWTDNNTTYSTATATVPGLIELFSDTTQSVAANSVSTDAGRTYGIQLNASGQAVVNVPWTDTNSGGTVTSVSVASANGFAGTVANSTTTPQITLSTSITGLLKGNGTAISAATAGTDYVTPSGNEVLTNKTLTDSTTTFQDNVDTTKKMQLQLSGISPATTRTLTVPNANGTIALTSDINDGALSVSIGAAGATNTTVTWGTSTGFTANQAAGTVTYDLKIGPALTALATIMNSSTPSTGVLNKTGTDTFSIVSVMTNPMTGLGDTIYGAASTGAPTRLAAPTVNGTYVLTSIPSASAAVAPSWQTLASAGIAPTASPTFTGTVTAGTITGTALYLQTSVGNNLNLNDTITIYNTATEWYALLNYPLTNNATRTFYQSTAKMQFRSGTSASTGGVAMECFGNANTTRYHVTFSNLNSGGTAGQVVGSISTNGSATAYTTSSDYRLKENVSDIGDAISTLMNLNPVRFNFIDNPDFTVNGFLAHEVQEIIPEAVVGQKDEIDENGKPIYQGIDQAKLVPILTAALQDAIREIDLLKARLSAAGL